MSYTLDLSVHALCAVSTLQYFDLIVDKGGEGRKQGKGSLPTSQCEEVTPPVRISGEQQQ